MIHFREYGAMNEVSLEDLENTKFIVIQMISCWFFFIQNIEF